MLGIQVTYLGCSVLNYLTRSNGEVMQILEKNGKMIFGWRRAGDLFEMQISYIH